MGSISAWRRVSSAGLALLVLVSSLTCMTVACRVVCAAGNGTSTVASAASDAALPPCHRPATGGSSTAPASAPGGGCDAGTVCCSTWLQDRDVFVLPAPVLERERGADDTAALLPAFALPAAPAVLLSASFAPDPPDRLPTRPAGPRPGRAPPAA